MKVVLFDAPLFRLGVTPVGVDEPAYRRIVAGPLYPLLRRLAPGAVTTTATLGRALLRVAAHGYLRRVLEGRDINAVGDSA